MTIGIADEFSGKIKCYGTDTTKPGLEPGPVEINTHEISYTLSLKLYLVY